MFKKLSYQEKVNKLELKRRHQRAENSLKSNLNTKVDTSIKSKKKKAKKAKLTTLKQGSMIKPIPAKMRDKLNDDPFMKKCCISNYQCSGRIQFHHALSYAGKRVNEYGSILPVCEYHHQKESTYKNLLNAIMYSRMTDEDRAKFPRKKWI